jgi:apolipoprotein N-acyltransferase
MIATRDRAKPIERNILTYARTIALGIAVASAAALTAAFPKLDWAWIAPLALGGLFWSWFVTPARAAIWIGFLSGVTYFAIMCSWFAVTAAGLVGPFGFLTVLGPAVIEAVSFALAAAAASIVYARAPSVLGPLGAAAAFALFEWLRSVGALGMPFAQIGFSQVGDPLGAFAAYGGSIFVTFVVAAIGALLASVVENRGRTAHAVIALVAIGCATLAANLFWPARHAPPATIPVSAIQGNIKQDVKWDPRTFVLSVERYTQMTDSVAATHPAFVLWPETVMTALLGDDDRLPSKDVRAVEQFRDRLGSIASRTGATLAVGALEQSSDGLHNALYFFAPNGQLDGIYRKRQLVPYAEWIPYGRRFLGWFPYLDQLGKQVPGREPLVVDAGALRIAPLICWESAFSDVVQDQISRGATLLAIATDDGWFGESAGPFQHAQIAQMRAIETGRWVLRAAATGVSGIIAPDGRWMERAGLDRQAIVSGFVGPPAVTFFSKIGPWTVAYVLAAFYLIALGIGTRLSAR